MITISGQITDGNSEPLTGANVFISDASGNVLNPPKGVTADVSGKYKINAEVGQYITASFVGMGKQTIKAVKASDVRDIVLSPSVSATFQEVEVFANKPKKKRIGLIVFLSLAGLLITIGAVVKLKQAH